MDGWSANTVDDCLPRQIAQNAGHYMLSNVAFHLRPIWLQTLVSINSESHLTSFPSFCEPSPEVAVLFYSNLSRRPFPGQFINLDLLLCAGFDKF